MSAIVVLPTYNEAENLQPIVAAILSELPKSRVLIVDDNSPDGTGRIADQLSQDRPGKVSVLHRAEKQGLGRAYLDGFARALDLGAEQIIQMDADFSHPPAVLPLLLAALKRYDFVLGSRYIPRGGVENWDLKRRCLSRMGNIYARLVLSLPVHDATGGLKAWNRRVLEYLLQAPIESSGYNFQIEMTAFALAAGFSCMEVPFLFSERRLGESKMSGNIIWEALIKTYQLRRKIKAIPKRADDFPPTEVRAAE